MPRLQLLRLEDRITPNTFTVTNTNDGTGNGSLGRMIQLANANTDADRIVFAPELRGQTLTLLSSAIFDGIVVNAAYAVNTPIFIEGTGQTLARGVNNPLRFFYVTTAGRLTLIDLTMAGGWAAGGSASGRASSTAAN
jgi:hypothetical protein